MKSTAKKFFLLGLGIAATGVAAGLAYKNREKIKKAAYELAEKRKLLKEDAEKLAHELIAEVEKVEKKVVNKIKPKKSTKVKKAKK
jgi:polyhydroxyalkanoate synthesis regulator phasin